MSTPQPQHSMLTPEMSAWLAQNSDLYEFSLIHALFYLPQRRTALLGIPLQEEDFASQAHALLFRAIAMGIKIGTDTGTPLSCPPSMLDIMGLIRAACAGATYEQDVIDEAIKMLPMLYSEQYAALWPTQLEYFAPWLTSVRGKRYARRAQSARIADVNKLIEQLTKEVAAVSGISASPEDDEMYQLAHSTDMEELARRSTGIAALDDCLNGGWGEGETYLFFSGTGGGKSILAGQCAVNELLTDGKPLLISTELSPAEYAARMVSCACSIPIPVVQDCRNFAQIRMAVARRSEHANSLERVDRILELIHSGMRIHKVSPDSTKDARTLLEAEVARAADRMGALPTWVCLDWLGSVVDASAGARVLSSSERSAVWEASASGCVKFTEGKPFSTLVLAQAVNNAHLKVILDLSDIGIGKGSTKNMVLAAGITNTIDKAAIRAAELGKADAPATSYLDDQRICVVKARKGVGRVIPVTRQFCYQRFAARANRR